MPLPSTSSVRVAVRVRPMTHQERDQDRKNFIDYIPDAPQIVVGQKHSFTFDHIYSPSVNQETVYETSVLPLVHKFLEGYNATVLAYGQTGAGKSFSMGIGLDSFIQKENEGIVPRFIRTMFEEMSKRQQPQTSATGGHHSKSDHHQISVSFLELHNEDLVDLLSPSIHTLKKENQPMVVIREDASGAISWSGIREEIVTHPHQLLSLLEKGSVARTTAATDMNISSSRSHAIFSIQLRQTVADDTDDHSKKTIISKFHFVDLAGSERLKRTNAVGHRAKEGISINSGLLALGNVISALGDESRRVSHIPYRDSKLTRLLQDSLGGNSQTLMLACVSPAWSNQKETLNTLKYANRARNIRNRVTINQETSQDQASNPHHLEQVKKLKAQIVHLRQELNSNDEFLHAVNNEMDSLKSQVESLNQVIANLVQELAQAKYQVDRQVAIETNSQKQEQEQEQHEDTTYDLAEEYARTIEELKLQVILLQQQSHYQGQPQQQTQKRVQQQQQSQPRQPQHRLSIQSVHPSMTSQTGSKKESSISDRKKKRHSYRFGSKKYPRSFSSIRKRQSIYHNSNTTSDDQQAGVKKSVTSEEWCKLIEKQSAGLDNDLAYVYSMKAATSEIVQGGFKDLMLTSTFHISDKSYANGNGPYAANNDDLVQLLRRFDDSLQKQQHFLQHLNHFSLGSTSSVQGQLRNESCVRRQHKQELDELKRQNDLVLKKHQHEHQALKRQYQQLIINSERARTQHNATILTLKQKLEITTRDKKKLMKKSKQDADRARDRIRLLEKSVQQLERQELKSMQVKKRLERDLHTQKQANKHAKEDIATLGAQLTSVAMMIQKVLQASNGKGNKPSKATSKETANNKKIKSSTSKEGFFSSSTDRTLLAKAVACARVRGYLVAQKHGISNNRRVSVASLQQRIVQKKQLIRRAITLYVQAYVPMRLHEQLEQRRDQLQLEQHIILAEHDALIHDFNNASIQEVNDRMNTVAMEYYRVCNQIQQLELQQQKQMKSKTQLSSSNADDGKSNVSSSNTSDDSDNDDDTWMDDIPFWNTDDAEVAYENVLTLVRTLEPEETRLILENMVHDVIRLETDMQQQRYIVASSESALQSLQKELTWRRQSQQDPFIMTPTSTTSSFDNTKPSTLVTPRPSVSSALRRSGLPTPRRSSCK